MYIISYDIQEDKIRNKAAKLLEGHGKRVQYSVFECRITEKQMKALYPKLEDLISESDNSSVLVYEICKSCEKRKLEIGMIIHLHRNPVHFAAIGPHWKPFHRLKRRCRVIKKRTDML